MSPALGSRRGHLVLVERTLGGRGGRRRGDAGRHVAGEHRDRIALRRGQARVGHPHGDRVGAGRVRRPRDEAAGRDGHAGGRHVERVGQGVPVGIGRGHLVLVERAHQAGRDRRRGDIGAAGPGVTARNAMRPPSLAPALVTSRRRSKMGRRTSPGLHVDRRDQGVEGLGRRQVRRGTPLARVVRPRVGATILRDELHVQAEQHRHVAPQARVDEPQQRPLAAPHRGDGRSAGDVGRAVHEEVLRLVVEGAGGAGGAVGAARHRGVQRRVDSAVDHRHRLVVLECGARVGSSPRRRRGVDGVPGERAVQPHLHLHLGVRAALVEVGPGLEARPDVVGRAAAGAGLVGERADARRHVPGRPGP